VIPIQIYFTREYLKHVWQLPREYSICLTLVRSYGGIPRYRGGGYVCIEISRGYSSILGSRKSEGKNQSSTVLPPSRTNSKKTPQTAVQRLPSVLVRHAEDRNETTDLRPSYEQTTRYIRLHTQYRTIAIHNKQHKQPHTRNKTGLKRAVRMRNHTIHLRMPIKLLSRMDRRQTATTATRRVSPKQNSRFLSRFLTLPHDVTTNRFTC
jgi:hypothetical protein